LPARAWAQGDHLTHRFNPELGVGRVTALEGRAIVVEFPAAKKTLRLSASTDALIPVDPSRPQPAEVSLVDRLTRGDLDPVDDFVHRLNLLNLLHIREADRLGSFLGGRITLFPHQLYVAERATASDPVRWLLADEVGLGKTIEASLILNRLVHLGKVERCLVVAPDALTVQWLGELWRKYHQVFTLLDAARLADVARDFGDDFNPFDVHRRSVVSLEMLIERPQLTEQAVSAGIDLLVVDEAQHLRRRRGHPGEPGWRAVAPIAALGRHVLLLSATPLEDDAHGFFRLLQLLRPDEFPEDANIEARLDSGIPLPPCTSSTRRRDIGGLPPRVGVPIALGERSGTPLRDAVEAAVRSAPAANAVTRRQKIDRVHRALASGAALAAVLGPGERELKQQAEAMDARDPRIEWLLQQAPRWRRAGDKTLIFVAHRETLEMVRAGLSQKTLASAVFHEELSPERRDIEVARFREPQGASLLVATECGSEGRNFEFCTRLVLFDLPWKPSIVEQRIGRLDRIGRSIPVEIVYFQPPRGIGLDVTRVFEALGLFREPLAGLEPQLAHVEAALDTLALEAASPSSPASLSPAQFDALIAEANVAHTRVREAAYHQLHRDPYRSDMAEGILARVPPDLDTLTELVVLTASERLGFTIERPRGRHVYAIELGRESTVDGLPGVPGWAAFVGSFDRHEAVFDDSLDFFASGHPLVEGIFAQAEDSPEGRVARIAVAIGRERGEGLAAFYKDGRTLEIVVLDAAGQVRPDWADAFRRRPFKAFPVTPSLSGDWKALVGQLAGQLDRSRRPHALAAIVVRPQP
jgi:ATP-dependent helicase HepA